MGLYILNAEIPVSCNKCYEIGLAHRLRDLGGHCPRMDLHYSPDEQSFKGDRRADCPMLDVPPHGRLIDADALDNKHFGHEYLSKAMIATREEMGIALSNIPLVINNAPTIIPADHIVDVTKMVNAEEGE